MVWYRTYRIYLHLRVCLVNANPNPMPILAYVCHWTSYFPEDIFPGSGIRRAGLGRVTVVLTLGGTVEAHGTVFYFVVCS